MSLKRLNVEKIIGYLFFRNSPLPQISTFSLGQKLGTVIDFVVTNVRSELFSKWLVRYVNFQKAVLRSDNKS